MDTRLDGAMAEKAARERWEALRGVLAAQRSGPALEPRPPGAATPASFAQRRLWFLERLEPGTPAHVLAVAHRLAGPLDPAALACALGESVRRHEALRTTLAEVDGTVMQVVRTPGDTPFPLHRIDLRPLDPDQRDAALRQRTDAEAATPFDLEHGPLLRATLLRTADTEHRLLISVHHAVFDGWSFDVFMTELGILYGAFAAGRPSPLPDPALHYADATLWQRRRLQGDTLDRLLAYWTERMAGPPPVLALPTDRPRHPGRDRREASRAVTLPADLADALRALSLDTGVTLFSTLLAGFQILLHRHSGETDITVGSPVANRNRAELAGMIGLLVNTLPLRVRFDGRPSVRALLAHTAEAVAGGLAHQDLPFELLVEAVNPPRLTGHPPLVQAVFAFQNVPRRCWSLPGLAVESWPLDSRRAACDLTLYMQDGPDGLTAALHYDSSLFDSATADAMLARLVLLLGGMAAEPERPVATLPLLPAAERTRLLTAWNATATPYPKATSIHTLFAEQAERAPDAVAVIGDDGAALTYGALDRRANRLARHLRALGVAAEVRVGLRLDRTPTLVVALLAILKAGGAGVPLDPSTPPPLAASRLRAAGAAVLVAEDDAPAELVETLAETGVALLRPGADRALIDRESDAPIEEGVPAERLACVLFTSGSTGEAKAVAVTHRGVIRLALGMGEAAPGPADTLLQLAPLSFDAATFEIWGALLNGARLALAPSPDIGSAPTPDGLGDAIRRHGVTLLWLTAGLFELVVELRVAALAPLRRLLVGGDVVSPAHAARLLASAPGCRLFNGYGPTEATTFTCLHPVTAEELAGGGPIPIGRPIANTWVHALDGEGQPVPVGVEGELWIGGDGLARGYLNDPELTRRRFVPDPFDPQPGARLYKTGDRVRRRPDGVLDFLGRADGQVKIRGVRVEPEAVETALRRCPGVAQAAVLAVGSGAADKCLAAWIVAEPGADLGTHPLPGLRERLRAWLPEAMIPAIVTVLDRLPLTANGKLDRRALPAPAATVATGSAAGDGPRDAVERTMLALFEELLGVRPLGIHDGFFDHGGHSLLAVRLAHRIEEAFGDALPLLALFETPTVAGLAARLHATPEPSPDDPTLITVRHGDPARTVFLVPGGHGGLVEMALYARLLRRLDGNPAVHGLRACGMDGAEPLPPSVEAMAAAHLEAVRRVQPAGPYRILGECVGAALAFEMARQLVERGETVAALVLLDGWCPSAAGQRHYEWIERPRALLRDRRTILRLAGTDLASIFHDHRQALARQSGRQRREQAGDAVGSLARAARRWARKLVTVATPQPGQTAAAERAYVRTLMSHRPRRYPGPVTLIASGESLRQGVAEGWRPWAGGGLTVHAVPGDHDSYLRDHAAATLERIGTCLRDPP
ncbi:non-ribosomal peptide synthetase [Azospirillum agricola]|uniref:non-ribosomal peptide synthetase n=1 Tax=Azospirillum agricola TaxID=1720247 RepID=UPI000A0F3D09|nr:non-ribosomal peptide synthetase [Azospirillum agricola]SMH41867.1 amino acid adenylation domain-containing protein [Azospirillum lipoferum]